ncbi:TerB family tellurite resistance protein [Pleionea sp. CnH1-48]|uniref:tellurite resistance TerB family protein n=1 Tax=Pleionea sp. CnH1-48 TaxID=2954494 RepID=UPI002096AC27|nr:TerB family tellurite resistance protein [Pleionea sp. CnH1-48]MCO7227165.1 TerB family tellurite resistance protein [Pleionea sp. CnH1-48]
MLQKLKDFFDKYMNVENASEPEDLEHSLRVAAAVLMIEVMKMDFEIKDEEQEQILSLLKSEFELNDEEADELYKVSTDKALFATDFHEFTQLINNHYAVEQKIRLIRLLWKVALADGKVHAYEEHLIRRVSDLLNLRHSEYIQAKLAELHELG